MNGMITTNENFDLDEILPKIREFKAKDVVRRVTCKEPQFVPADVPQDWTKEHFKVALMDFGAKKNISRELAKRGCDVTIYPAYTSAQRF